MSNTERINIKFIYYRDENGKMIIKYPDNVPNCNGYSDCGIKITREEAYKILNDQNLIKKNTRVFMEVNGMNWDVSLSEDEWTTRHVSIHLTTGEISKVRTSQRID